ncbi:DUF2975 domain-containing protein [Romboutsia sp. Marseille-P6047]|uniref:DUF2975 domain-containing protein n=1 Tax=Romboutsia sp. Marseille-P6047 TaxID=2161817 RepID=UPI000F05DD84|nr:DUF2975 domain-containing protein [Romboutsia sp. Marseille-P6047]
MKYDVSRTILIAFLYVSLAILVIGLTITPFATVYNLYHNFNFNIMISMSFTMIYLFNFFMIIKKILYIITYLDNDPFTYESVKSFKLMGYCLILNAIIELIIGDKSVLSISTLLYLNLSKGFMNTTMVICFVSSMVCFMISEVFSKIVKEKDNNNLIM